MNKRIGFILTAALSAFPCAYADDIDIYVNAPVTGSEPYMMLTLDWRPSIFNSLCQYGVGNSCDDMMDDATYGYLESTYIDGDGLTQPRPDGDQVSTFEGFVAVLQTVLYKTDSEGDYLYDSVRMGLMISNKDDGGTILKGYELLGKDEDGNGSTGRQDIIDTLKLIPDSGTSNSHFLQASETYYEWYRYLNGGAVINGTAVANNFGGSAASPALPSYDPDTMDASETNYKSPFSASECPKLYSVLVAMNSANQDDGLDDEIEADMSADAAFKFENMVEYLTDPLTNLLPDSVGLSRPLEKLWVVSDSGSLGATEDWAWAGSQTSPYDISDPEQLVKDLGSSFDQVINESSTFVAASVPVNVFNRTDTLDNVYIALFEAQTTIHWPGNLKKLKLEDTDSDGVYDEVVDKNGNAGFESNGSDIGRITFDALTFWTDSAELPHVDGLTDGRDGREVARGGAGQKVVGFIDDGTHVIGSKNSTPNARQVFLEPTSGSTLDDFDADNSTADALITLLGAADRAEALKLIKWGRGEDAYDDDLDNNKTEPRSWIMSEAIHSRPLAINYGTTGGYSTSNPNIRIFMGTNDGMFHIFENTTTAGDESGEEIFAFYPREVLGNLTLRQADTEPSSKMRYGLDGTPVALVIDNDEDGNIEAAAGDKVYVYVGMRRGGNSYYAFDVSDPSATPTLLWKITNTSTGFSELGLTFSTPVVGKIKYGSTSTDVLIFAGGYNGGWNGAYTSQVGKDVGSSDDSVGNAIYIVNAKTGELIWKAYGGVSTASVSNGSAITGYSYTHAEMVDSIPSSVTALESFSGNIHRLYVGDTGGAVWRVDLPEVSSVSEVNSKWFVSKFAELGTDGTTTDRRFFHAPDVVESYDATGNFDGVLISSGNRADPLETDVDNYMFYLKDRVTDSGNTSVKARGALTISDSDIPDQTGCVTGSEGGCSSDLSAGWKIQLTSSGEKGLASPLVDYGLAFFSSYVPESSTNPCETSEGDGYLYVVNLADGSAAFNDNRKYYVGPGIPPGAIALGGDVIYLPGGGGDLGDTDGDGTDEGRQKLFKSLGKNLWIMYWREPGIDDL